MFPLPQSLEPSPLFLSLFLLPPSLQLSFPEHRHTTPTPHHDLHHSGAHSSEHHHHLWTVLPPFLTSQRAPSGKGRPCLGRTRRRIRSWLLRRRRIAERSDLCRSWKGITHFDGFERGLQREAQILAAMMAEPRLQSTTEPQLQSTTEPRRYYR